jgi:hypothetical protein
LLQSTNTTNSFSSQQLNFLSVLLFSKFGCCRNYQSQKNKFTRENGDYDILDRRKRNGTDNNQEKIFRIAWAELQFFAFDERLLGGRTAAQRSAAQRSSTAPMDSDRHQRGGGGCLPPPKRSRLARSRFDQACLQRVVSLSN